MKLPSATRLGIFGAIALLAGRFTLWLLETTAVVIVFTLAMIALYLLGFIPIHW
jgi:hypothetical protein